MGDLLGSPRVAPLFTFFFVFNKDKTLSLINSSLWVAHAVALRFRSKVISRANVPVFLLLMFNSKAFLC